MVKVKVIKVGQDTVVLGKNGRHSFGRAQDRVSPPTQIMRTNWKRNVEERHARKRLWTRERAPQRNRLDLKLVREKEEETRFEGCELKKEREMRGRKTSREDVIDMKHSRNRVAARNKGSWSSSPLNVTQAAGHEERWRERNHKKKVIKVYSYRLIQE